MIDFDEFGELLDEIANSFPSEIYTRLNGGVNLLPDERVHPESLSNNDLYVLGEYHVNRLGRYINIYYGSFMRRYANYPVPYLKRQIEHTLKHEFLHHLESLAGEDGLEVQDRIFLERYRQRFRRDEALDSQ